MAITITHQPQVYTPSENQIVWQVSTDATTLVYFKVDMYQAGTTNLVNTFNIYPTPASPTVSYIELGRILRSFVKWQADNTYSALSKPLNVPVFAYRLVFTEILYDPSTGIYSTGATYDNSGDKFWVWNASLDRIAFKAYVQNNFVVNSSTTSRFLTNKPDGAKVNDFSSEVLYFLQDSQTALSVQVKTYNGSTLLNTYNSTVTGLTTNNMYRVHVSPKALNSILAVDFTDVTKYTVQLLDGSSAARSELRKYFYTSFECNYDYHNIWFSNNLGGFDVYQSINPQKTIATKEVNIRKNIYQFDDAGLYTDNNGGIYNPSIENINVTTTTSFKAVSRPLTDNEAVWLIEMFQSRQAYLELADGMLVPITINAKSYPIMLNKYKREQPNWLDIDYTVSDNLQPTI